jgi:chromosome segregation ATPase
MTQLFKKPDLQIKSKEAYLKTLDTQILERERSIAQLDVSFEEKRGDLDNELAATKEKHDAQVRILNDEIFFKREERVELERPLDARREALDIREQELDDRENLLRSNTQRVLERERATENMLESVRDLSDSLGAARIKLNIREERIKAKEAMLNDSENRQLVAVESFSKYREGAIAEVNLALDAVRASNGAIDARENNLRVREEKLIRDALRVQSQRQALLAAKKPL